MANTLLLFLLAPHDDSDAGAAEGTALAKHALASSCTELAPLRPLAVATLVQLLKLGGRHDPRRSPHACGAWKAAPAATGELLS
jgi:hypothetical protein